MMKRAMFAGLMLMQGWAGACDHIPSVSSYLLHSDEYEQIDCPAKQFVAPDDERQCGYSSLGSSAVVQRLVDAGYDYKLNSKNTTQLSDAYLIKESTLGDWLDMSVRITPYLNKSFIIWEYNYNFRQKVIDSLGEVYWEYIDSGVDYGSCLNLISDKEEIFECCDSGDVDATGRVNTPIKFKLKFSPDRSIKPFKDYVFYLSSDTCQFPIIEEVYK